MGHLFSSGEILYKKNEKKLPEGLLIGTTLEYDEVELDTRYICIGTIQDEPVKVEFVLSPEEFQSVKNRSVFRILMQSDILLADWKSYKIIEMETGDD